MLAPWSVSGISLIERVRARHARRTHPLAWLLEAGLRRQRTAAAVVTPLACVTVSPCVTEPCETVPCETVPHVQGEGGGAQQGAAGEELVGDGVQAGEFGAQAAAVGAELLVVEEA